MSVVTCPSTVCEQAARPHADARSTARHLHIVDEDQHLEAVIRVSRRYLEPDRLGRRARNHRAVVRHDIRERNPTRARQHQLSQSGIEQPAQLLGIPVTCGPGELTQGRRVDARNKGVRGGVDQKRVVHTLVEGPTCRGLVETLPGRRVARCHRRPFWTTPVPSRDRVSLSPRTLTIDRASLCVGCPERQHTVHKGSGPCPATPRRARGTGNTDRRQTCPVLRASRCRARRSRRQESRKRPATRRRRPRSRRAQQ